eukprot:356174-Chlamydomonas_euryale.AAC.12
MVALLAAHWAHLKLLLSKPCWQGLPWAVTIQHVRDTCRCIVVMICSKTLVENALPSRRRTCGLYTHANVLDCCCWSGPWFHSCGTSYMFENPSALMFKVALAYKVSREVLVSNVKSAASVCSLRGTAS